MRVDAMRVAHRLLARFAFCGVLLLPGLARAQQTETNTNVDAERFKPAVTPDGWVTAEGSGLRPTADPWEFGLYLNYGVNPLVAVDAGNDLSRQFVGGHLGFDAIASVTLADPFVLGLDMPLYAAQSGDYDPSFAGLGDLRLVPKLRIMDDREDAIGLALTPEVRLPTHTGDFSGGARNVVVIPKVILDHRFRSGIRIGFNLGALFRQKTEFFNVSAGSELVYAGALGYTLGGLEGKTELGVELNGAAGLVAHDTEELPLELFAYIRQVLSPQWDLIAGPGFGLIAGYGVPTIRIFAGVRFRPTSHDADDDGISDDVDRCPNIPEDRDGYQDTDGCPDEDPDADRDGVPDWDDQCPDAKETINGYEDDDGCPDTGSSQVIYEDGQFRVLDAVHFEHGSAKLQEDSYGLLDQVALTIKAHPEMKVRVEGHTDDTGPEVVNRRLSQNRAESVRRYLIRKGVQPGRVEAKGYGETRPLERGTSEEARAANRRVEFVVIEGSEPSHGLTPTRVPAQSSKHGSSTLDSSQSSGGASVGGSVQGSAHGSVRGGTGK
jgi:OOP family OmpA-OmpF porin